MRKPGDQRSVNSFVLKILFALAILFASHAHFVRAEGPLEKDVAFTADCDKTKQRYVLVFPKDFDAEKPRDMLIALHGHGSDRWQFAREKDGEFKAPRDLAAEHQMLYVTPDYRARTSWMGPKAESDMVQIIADLRKQYKIERVFICGGSMGGTSALAFAALHPDLISGVASMNGTANLLEYTKFQKEIVESYGGKKSEIPEVYKTRSAEYWPERLTMPIAFTTGGLDTIVPPDSVKRLYDVLQKMKRPVRLIHQEQGGHSTTYEDTAAALKFMYESAAAYKAKESNAPAK